MKKIIICLAIISILSACTEDTTVMIRVKNVSTFNYKKVVLGNDSLGNIAAGQYTNYKVYSAAYRYCSYELIADNDTIGRYAYDFVGEKLLESGKYTYEINVVKNEDKTISTTIHCVKD